jgi:hypothetical protein
LKEDTNQVARQLLHWEIGAIEWLVAEGTQLGADDGVMSHTAVNTTNSSHMYRPTEYAIKPIRDTQQHGDNSTKHNMPMSQQGWGAIDPHRQTIVDLEYYGKEFRDE